MKKTLDQKLHSRKLKKPGILYIILGYLWKLLFYKKYNINVTYKTDIKKVKGPIILLSNHASRLDYMFTALPLLPKKFNFVAGYNEFFRSHLAGIFKIMNVIPKKNFTADIYTIKEVSRIIKKKGNIILYPEGMSSISGANQPVAVGTGKFIKHFKLPVYYSLIKGGYLTSPKYDLNERLGRVEVEYDILLTPEEIEKLSATEIEDLINKTLYHDDYAWNKEQKNEYKVGNFVAHNLHHLLYWCPRCNKEFTMKGEFNKIYCTSCNNGATITNTYEMIPFDDTCIIPSTQTEWFNKERALAKEEIKDPNFKLTEKVKLGVLPLYKNLKNQATSEIVGEGLITLNHDGLTYIGTYNNEVVEMHIGIKELPTYGMCTDLTRFYTFYKGKFIEFYPEGETVEKWFLTTESLHRLHNGKWRDFN
ncbi:MAG: 1-acyl-sn-glycerol-3-phosphate acyltransferase [Bacilli bacterium]|nr:1-acyl-sn-glycerol-3-phosphate acyltransferase [Bacilli bacterium]